MSRNRRTRLWPLLAAASFLFWVHQVWAQQPPAPATAEGTLSFGRALLDAGDSYRAATEFLRFLHHYPDHHDTTQAMEGLGRAYGLAGRYDEAAAVFQRLLATAAEEEAPTARRLLGASLYQGGRYAESSAVLLETATQTAPEGEQTEAAIVLGTLAALRAGDETLPPSAHGDLAEQYRRLPQKSPALAGTLSAALPGAGHFYCGRPRDGTVSFLLNAVFLWGTYESARREQWALTGILGFFELGWYSGNIVSSVNAAHKWNRREQGRFLRRWEEFALPRWQFSLAPRGVNTRLAWTW